MTQEPKKGGDSHKSMGFAKIGEAINIGQRIISYLESSDFQKAYQ
jgi:hypothetical protein